MAKRPAILFYPADWRSNAKLRRCSPAARGVWMDAICLLHDSDEYGTIRCPLKEIARAIGAAMVHLRELVEKGVLKGSDTHLADAYVYVPRSGRRDGTPVTLISAQPGPIWFSSRMVRDEYIRSVRGAGSRFGEDAGPSEGSKNAAPNGAPNDTPKLSPKPPLGDGSSSSSSFSLSSSTERTSSLRSDVGPATKRKRSLKRLLPDDWPTPTDLSWALQYWREENEPELIDNIKEQARKAYVHHHARGSTFADWSAAWRMWAIKAVEFARKDRERSTSSAQPRTGALSIVEGIYSWQGDDDR